VPWKRSELESSNWSASVTRPERSSWLLWYLEEKDKAVGADRVEVRVKEAAGAVDRARARDKVRVAVRVVDREEWVDVAPGPEASACACRAGPPLPTGEECPAWKPSVPIAASR
jgi:hypothetical protein